MKLFAGIAALGGANGIYLSELDRNGTLQELTRYPADYQMIFLLKHF